MILRDAEIVAHQLALVGVRAACQSAQGRLVVQAGPGAQDGTSDTVVLLLQPASEVLPTGLRAVPLGVLETPLTACAGTGCAWERLPTFHPAVYFEGEGLMPVVCDAQGRVLWAFQPRSEAGGCLLIGTDLTADLTLLRQGRPKEAGNPPTEALWGYAGERPNYLFEAQLDPEKPFDRPADWWLWTLRDALVRHGGVVAQDVLPGGAAGMIVITGDDDQAPLADYRAQRELLGDLPVTYFLHPLASLTAMDLAELSEGRTVEWELHPDALETPDAYAERLEEQVAWYRGLVGRAPRLVRNHGFLNDGYWGHAGPWLARGIVGSSNLPGFNGRVLNGSLLPARLALDGRLTPHWSLLTAFGDGVMFVLDWDAETALEAVLAAGRRIVESGVPGVLVFNLHPANHVRATALHQAARQLVAEGFVAATFGQALDWFECRRELPVSRDAFAPEMRRHSEADMPEPHPEAPAPVVSRARSLLRALFAPTRRV